MQASRRVGADAQDWGTELFGALSQAGGVAYSNYAVGYNNVDTKAATKAGIPVGNTPGAGQLTANALGHLVHSVSLLHLQLQLMPAPAGWRGLSSFDRQTCAGELAAALTLAAARRVVEADRFMRGGQYEGWLPHLFVGNLLQVGHI